MDIKVLTPKKAINKAFLKVKPSRNEIENFKKNLIVLLDSISKETEEHHKNLIIDFLKNTYYKDKNYINTKGNTDLVIHNDKSNTSSVGVIIEAKRPSNKNEMFSSNKINSKALQELILYYLRERITNKNLEVKHLIITDVNEWFIFDEHLFERLFAQNKKLVKQFEDFETSKKTTDVFYKEIAYPYIENILSEITYTHFNIQDYQIILRNDDKQDDSKLIALYKLLSPEHLLKLPFINDSNSLDKRFYSELLHIIGLIETKQGGKKLIERNKESERHSGTILEDAIIQIESLDKLSRLHNLKQYGITKDEQLFNVGLELAITWINRILFLKLLEAQLISYHKGDKSFAFLNSEKIKSYDSLNALFFQVLAYKLENRNVDVKKSYEKVPYLNSSLFEPAENEHNVIYISNLKDDKTIPIFSQTVLKDNQGKKRVGELPTLQYLLDFLDAYDFGADSGEEIQEENKPLINASVLGLIFEKINGYKDGSFFTPSFITMYMCRETIRKSIIQKFNEVKEWDCKTINDIYNKIEDRNEANSIVNSIKICDPAVGSGHFLVSALNEIIAIKSDLKILQDRNGNRLKEYNIEVENDELIVTDEDGDFFKYNPKNKESQRIQETLFHEKQTIIENCLFGVDINPNSVKICSLRLWIELLKNAYYKNEIELETLPNIDINIKCGNSLISRFPIDADIKQVLKKSNWTIDSYRNAVNTYRNAKNKAEKSDMKEIIDKIKTDFKTNIDDPFKKKMRNKRNLVEKIATEINTQKQWGEKISKQLTKDLEKATNDLKKLEIEKDTIQSNIIYENALEWRFEFPEVLNDDGDFVGFDVIIGNPPYIYRNSEINSLKDYFNENYFNTSGNYELYKFFIELSLKITKKNGLNSLITNSSFLLQTSFEKTRQFLLNNSTINLIVPLGGSVFDEATVDSVIYVIKKSDFEGTETFVIVPKIPIEITKTEYHTLKQDRFLKNEFLVFDYLLNDIEYSLVNKLLSNFPKIYNSYDFGVGINTGYIRDEISSISKIDDRYHPMVKGNGITKYGEVKSEGYIMYDKEFIKSKGELARALPDEKFFKEPKVLVTRTRNISLKERIIATIDYEQKYNLNRISNIISKNKNSIEGLLGVLNSKLFNWLYTKRFFDYEIKPIYLKNSPQCDTNNIKLIELVKEILSIKKENPNTDISLLEKEIDKIVYQLYGLTDEEIEIIENS